LPLPSTKIFPEFVIAPLVITDRLPVIVDAPMITALVSFMVTSAPVTPIVPKLLLALLNVTFSPLADTVVVPGTTNTPDWVTAPFDTVAVRSPVNVNAPKTNAVVSVIDTFAIFPELAAKTGVAVKSFDPLFTVID
jgi:hypothetical protein